MYFLNSCALSTHPRIQIYSRIDTEKYKYPAVFPRCLTQRTQLEQQQDSYFDHKHAIRKFIY